MEYLVISAVVIIAVAFVICLLKSTNKTVTADSKGVITLKMHIITKITGIISFIATVGLSILAVFTVKTTEDAVSAFVLIALFLVLVLFLTLAGTNYRLNVDEERLVSYSLFNKPTEILWEQVKDFGLNKMGSLVVITDGDRKIKVFIRLVGFLCFAEIAARKLDAAQYRNAFEKLRRYGIKISAEENESIENKVRNEIIISRNIKSGASWFYWIAGLSIVNSAIVLFDGSFNFVAGLGITQIIDGLAYYISDNIGTIAIAAGIIIDIFIAGIFVFFGVMANRGKKWSFIIGMILYGLDTMVFFIVKDYFGVGFHVFALYCIYNGFKALNITNKIKNAETEMIISEQHR
jgi:hypothetical protein